MKSKILSVLLRVAVYVAVMALTIVVSGAVYVGVVLPKKAVGPFITEWNDGVGRIVKDLRYGNGEYQNYDLYLPADKQAHALILFIHGGSFIEGDKADEDVRCKFFASKGYVTATANYSLIGKVDGANLNMMYDELCRCVAAMKEQCAKEGYQIDGMAVSGESAGGCLAMVYAYRMGQNSAIPVKLVFQQTGPADFAPEGWNCQTDEDKAAFVTYITGKQTSVADVQSGMYLKVAAEVSPASLVNATTVPTLSAYGPKDKIVPVGLKFKLFDSLNAYGVPNEYIEYPHSGHAMLNDRDRFEEFVQKSLQYCAKYLN